MSWWMYVDTLPGVEVTKSVRYLAAAGRGAGRVTRHGAARRAARVAGMDRCGTSKTVLCASHDISKHWGILIHKNLFWEVLQILQ